jgi:hypothetical protein
VQDDDGATSNQATVTVTVQPSNYANIAPFSSVQCSSENISTNQTCDKAIDEIIDGWPGDYTKEWATSGEHVGAWIQLDWSSAFTIERIVFYDRPNLDDQVLSGTIRFGDDTTVNVGTLPNGGAPLEIVLSQPKTTSSLRFTVNSVSSSTRNIGLSEIEVFAVSSNANSSSGQ